MNLVGKHRAVMSLALLTLLLIISNFAFVYSNGWYRVGWQLFSFGGLIVVCRVARLSLADIGLSKSTIVLGFKYGLAAIGAIALALIIVFLVDQSVFRDSRYHQSLSSALYAALLIIPLKTVIFEELAFRGIMPVLLKGVSVNLVGTFIVSSLSFGLWHILSAPKGDALTVGHYSNLMVVVGIFTVTTVAGALLYFLRYQSNSLMSSIIAHWFLNGSAIVLASLSWLHHH